MTEAQEYNYKRRWNEILFVRYIIKLIQYHGYSTFSFTTLEGIAGAAGVDYDKLLVFVRQIREGHGELLTYPEEVTFLARRLGITFRQAAEITGVCTAQQQRIWSRIDQSKYEDISYRLNDADTELITTFMKHALKIGDVTKWMKLK